MARGTRKTASRRRHQVLGTRELRDQLPNILREFRRDGADAEPVVGGANRNPEVVLLSYDGYLDLMDDLDNLSIQAIYAERAEGNDELAGRTLEDAARELGFDPDELFEGASPREGVAAPR
jgi:hypothetical protein